MVPFFAQESIHTGWLMAIIPSSVTVGTVATILINLYLKRRELAKSESAQERQNRIDDDSTAIQHYAKLNARLDRELKERDERDRQKDAIIDRIREELSNERITSARMLVWIRHLEELSPVGKFKPWDEVVRETQGTRGQPVRSAPETTVE